MKLILLHNVKKVGKQGEVVDVADGYANGFLLPKKLARVATSDAVQQLKHTQEKKAHVSEEEKKKLKLLFTQATGKEVSIKASANEKGHLFAAIGTKDLVAALQTSQGVILDESQVILKEPIKDLGSFEIKIKVGDQEGKLLAVISKK